MGDGAEAEQRGVTSFRESCAVRVVFSAKGSNVLQGEAEGTGEGHRKRYEYYFHNRFLRKQAHGCIHAFILYIWAAFFDHTALVSQHG